MGQVNVNVPQELVQPVIEAEIQSAIIKALGNQDNLVREAVNALLHQKCNSRGEISSSSYENKHNVVDVLVHNAMVRTVKAAINKWIEENTPILEEAVKKQLKNSPNALAKALVGGFAEYAKTNTSIMFEVSLKPKTY